MTTVSILYFSGTGHTTQLAEAVLKGAASVAGASPSASVSPLACRWESRKLAWGGTRREADKARCYSISK